jgi:hypothetical protein
LRSPGPSPRRPSPRRSTISSRGRWPCPSADHHRSHSLGRSISHAVAQSHSDSITGSDSIVSSRVQVAIFASSSFSSRTDGMDGPVLLPRADAPGGRFYPPNLGEPGAPRLHARVAQLRRQALRLRGGRRHRARSQHTQPQLAAFAEYVDLPFALLSDTDLALASSLRLPTFRAAGVDRLKGLTMIVDDQRTIRAVQFPVTTQPASVG